MLTAIENMADERWLLFSAALSLCVGSFINVLIYRLPKMLDGDAEAGNNQVRLASFNLFFPASRCPHCSENIKPYDNIPLVSWVVLRGRCRYCRQNISLRYPLIEMAVLLAGVATAAFIGMGIDWLFMVALFSLLLALTAIDMERQLLPDCLTLSLLWVGLLWHGIAHPQFLPAAVMGAIAGYLSLWLLYWGFRLLTGREGLGYGDFKLLAALGAWTGYETLPHILLIGSSCSLAWLALQRVMGGRSWSQPLPFGPGLALAGAAMAAYLWMIPPLVG
ncbi:prepilin peptidase [Serratia entomophila]|uniref:Prepilin leader peptidase/N-methyltransferase n=1 Tax=Serratia entomophila TaxID=42906 RepID=A0ABY5CVG1_9GAMM|nr:A24 family peptidase [Serratia entomophila]USV01977.1 prepilin peptidase [Serratia entomophila]CAI0713867.1 Pectic enzymes secretion protein outO [Serratia entomophila]CAI0771082.1 Pectic enzymes secretion protein outO [Serratia entomophila]CAI0810777.1 Pectic enzymes secretion protein outO [Serratia entomophila]CAI0863563.1 Pectic enzymes secretion protein outO [Serratia entomophila]